MGCEPNVSGPRGFAQAMAKSVSTYDRHTCPNIEENWHVQVIKLKRAIDDTPSAELANIMKSEIKAILKKRKATKIVSRFF
jgi:hypothetical protein